MLTTDNFSKVSLALNSCATPISVLQTITPTNREFLGDPAKIIIAASIRFIALKLVNKLALIICHMVLDGALGI